MNIIKHLEWDKPSIEIEDRSFNIEITGDVFEITCDWDHGWGGRGTESCTIPLQVIEGLLAEFKRAKTCLLLTENIEEVTKMEQLKCAGGCGSPAAPGNGLCDPCFDHLMDHLACVFEGREIHDDVRKTSVENNINNELDHALSLFDSILNINPMSRPD